MQRPDIPEIPYQDFSKLLHGEGLQRGLPISATVELTARCNLRCAHCYINLPAGDRQAREQELSYQQWARILDEMAAEGCLWVLITGGEPLLRPDFRDIYLHAKKLGMLTTLFTNGTLLTPEVADLLQEWPPFEVEITVYGRTKETYEQVTRMPGSYEKCLRGIDLLLERGIPLTLKTMIMSLNIHEYWDLKDWVESFGLTFRSDMALTARLDGGTEPAAVRLTPEQVVDIDMRDQGRLQLWQQMIKVSGRRARDRTHLHHCGAGVDSFHLDAYGGMYMCLMLRHARYDLMQGSLAEGWQEFIPRLREQKPRGEYRCLQCDLLFMCRQCPGWAFLEHGTLETPVDYVCRVTHRLAQELGISPSERP